MSLYNDMVPKYYGQFRDRVLSGEIPVCKEIAMEMCRIDALIADPEVYYDPDAVEGWISFCEEELTLTDGSEVHLLDSFKLWAEEIFGWYEFVERKVYERLPDGSGHYVYKTLINRLTKKQYIITARGSAKSVYEAFIQSYYLSVDTSTTHQVHTSPTMKQSEEIMMPIRTAITKSRGPFYQFLTAGSMTNTTGSSKNRPKLFSSKEGIKNTLTGSFIEVRPMSIDKLQGLNSKVNTVDEWLSGDTREDVIGPLEQGASKNDEYIVLAVSSEGTTRNGVGDSIKMELTKILRGEYINKHVSIFWYKLDDISEVNDPSTWIKANPNLGVTVSYEAYQDDVEKAEHSPSARNDILAKRFGLPMEGFTYYFTYTETLTKPYRNYHGLACAMGGDMSEGDDFCSFAFAFPFPSGLFGIRTRNYITEFTLHKLIPAMRSKYEEFISEGSLVVLPGPVLDMNEIYEDLDKFINDNEFDVRCFGYDPYNAKEFVERWSRENGPFGIEKVPQGARTESVPLGELKKLAESDLLWFDESIMNFAMGNCIAETDNNGNRKLTKRKREEKIDPVAAMLDAYIAYKHYKEVFE